MAAFRARTARRCNGLFIVGLAALICPIQVSAREVGWALAFGVVTTVLTFPRRDGLIPRWRGLALLALYAAFVAAAFKR